MNTKTVFLYALLLFGLFLFALSSCKRKINKESTGNVDLSGDINPIGITGDGSKTGDSSGDSSKTVYSSGDSSGDGSKTGDSSGNISPKSHKLNDTGLTVGGSYPSGNNPGCTGAVITQQDCSHGRDALAAAGKLTKTGAGEAGFDYTKLGKDGTALTFQNATWSDNGNEAAGTRWSCVKDNYTGMVWEVKTNDGSVPIAITLTDTEPSVPLKNPPTINIVPTVSPDNIHHKDNTYRWGGLTALGKENPNKEGPYYDDWDSLVSGTNSEKLCGFDDWRLPTIEELRSITHYGRTLPTIDPRYFPNAPKNWNSNNWYWSSSPKAGRSTVAWNLDFGYGYDYTTFRIQVSRVRLVRFVP